MAEDKKKPRIVTVQRKDKKWGWELKSINGQIIATDGSQGYEKESAARQMADRIVIDGEFNDAEHFRRALTNET